MARPFVWEEGADLAAVARSVQAARNIVVLVGAGASVSAGVPDFRSAGTGIYAQVRAVEGLEGLEKPEDLFDLQGFLDAPAPRYRALDHFFGLWRGGGSPKPTRAHAFLAALQQRRALLRVYTQNIDMLEEDAGLDRDRVVYCHGSLRTLSCTQCGSEVATASVAAERQVGKEGAKAPGGKRKRKQRGDWKDWAPRCRCGGLLRPDITLFGERLPPVVGAKLAQDRNRADLFLVIGTSMRVAPLNSLVELLRQVPQVAINRDELPHRFDAQLLGPADMIVADLEAALRDGEWGEGGAEKTRAEAGGEGEEHVPGCTFLPPRTSIWEGGNLAESGGGASTMATPTYAYECDCCGGSIEEGDVWSCSQCFEFDLCGECFEGGRVGRGGAFHDKKSDHAFACAREGKK